MSSPGDCAANDSEAAVGLDRRPRGRSGDTEAASDAASGLRLDELRADLALVNEIPLYEIPDEASFTLDQHLAFQRITDGLPGLLELAPAVRAFIDELDREGIADDGDLRGTLAEVFPTEIAISRGNGGGGNRTRVRSRTM